MGWWVRCSPFLGWLVCVGWWVGRLVSELSRVGGGGRGFISQVLCLGAWRFVVAQSWCLLFVGRWLVVLVGSGGCYWAGGLAGGLVGWRASWWVGGSVGLRRLVGSSVGGWVGWWVGESVLAWWVGRVGVG